MTSVEAEVIIVESEAKLGKLISGGDEKSLTKGSKIFAPFRVLGRVADKVPSLVTYRGGVAYVTSSVGKSFHIYDVILTTLPFLILII